MSDHTLDTTASDPHPDAPAAGQALRPDQTFVVQLRGPTADRGDLQGRVEHVVSGRAVRFRTTAELIEFLMSMPGGSSR